MSAAQAAFPDPPAVSVLMPCYNAAATLPESLNSLARQTLTNFEIIAVDDGSSDETPEILKSWAASDPRLRVVYQQHGGIIPALNTGLRFCRAPYVARMDADDRCHSERLARQVAFLDQHPEVGVVSCLVAGFPAGQVREGYQLYIEWLNSLVTDADIRREMFVESPMAHPSVTFRLDLVKSVGGYQEHGWPEDYDLWLRMYLAGVSFAKVPEVLLEWREHPQRLTRVEGRYAVENFLRAKAHYLSLGPLAGRDAVIIWGAGMMGRRLSKHLLRRNVPLVAFIDVDPRKIGRTRRGLPVLSPDDLLTWWRRFDRPALLAAVGARNARLLIRAHLEAIGLAEGRDWWCSA